RHRRMDRALHRHARARASGCVPGRRPGAAQAVARCRRGRGHAAPAHRRTRPARRGLAPMARLRRDPRLARGRAGPGCGDRGPPRPFTEESRMSVLTTIVDSPVGPLFLAADAQGLRAIEFRDNRHPVRRDDDWREGDSPLLQRAREQLDEYFARQRRGFDLPLPPLCTAYQRSVRTTLASSPHGGTIRYALLATHIYRPP